MSRSWHWPALALALLLVSPSPRAAAQVTPEREARLRRMADALTGDVERLRGLKFKHSVPKGIQTRDQLRAFIKGELDREMPAAKLLATQTRLAKIGLIPAGLDLGKLFLDVLTESVAGFYDPRTRRLYLIAEATQPAKGDWAQQLQSMLLRMIGLSEDQLFMAHELTHALQDQHFKLLGLDLDKLDNEDRQTAIKSLFEGDATVVMFDFLLGKLGMDSGAMRQGDMLRAVPLTGTGSKALDGAPRYVKYGLIVPYMQGMAFVGALKDRGGWQAVDRAYADPPASMEQVLHPEKYITRDAPTSLDLTPFDKLFKDAGAESLGAETLGELYVQVLVGDHTKDEALAKRAAEGWDGDRYQVWRNPRTGQTSLLLATTWDSDRDAEEFMAAAERLVRAKYPRLRQAVQSERLGWQGTRVWTDESMQHYFLGRRGQDVFLLESAPAALVEPLIAEMARIKKTEVAGGLPAVPALERVAGPVETSRPETAPASPFAHQVPAGWQAAGGTDEAYPLILKSPASGGEIKVGVLETTLTHEQVAERFAQILPRKIAGYQATDSGALEGLALPAYQLRFSGTPPGKTGPHRCAQIVMQGRGKLYTLMLVTPAASAEKDGAAFQQFAKSFKPR